jgi:hypothetical protein
VVEVLIKKIKSLAESCGAKVLFDAVPQRDVFLLDYCDFHLNLSFFKKRDQIFKKGLFKRIEEKKPIRRSIQKLLQEFWLVIIEGNSILWNLKSYLQRLDRIIWILITNFLEVGFL